MAGVAAEIGVLVLTFIDENIAQLRKAKNRALTAEEINTAVLLGTSARVRPVAMTTLSTLVGLLPIMWGSGTGSDVMHRIAAPMVGGLITVILLGLLVLPVLYGWVLQFKEVRIVVIEEN